MKRFLFATALIGAVTFSGLAQKTKTQVNANAGNETSAEAKGRQINLQSAAQIAAELQGTLDAKHAKVGDRVVLKTTQAVKENGEVIVPKGAQLIGHVTDVQQQTKSSSESHIGLVFDQLRSGSSQIPITASIISITQARSSAQAGNNRTESDTMASSSTSARSSKSSGGSGGLLGGVGNTVGGVVNTTTNTVGNVAGSTTNAVGSTVGATTNTAGNLTGSLSGLQITQSTGASAEGGSTLSLTGGNLRLDTGAKFQLAVSSSTSARPNP
jgi:hypothetical protein